LGQRRLSGSHLPIRRRNLLSDVGRRIRQWRILWDLIVHWVIQVRVKMRLAREKHS
jgi:hypothetical protein